MNNACRCLDVDRGMDEMYAGSGVVFVQDILEMARVVEDLLGDEQKLQALGARSKRFIETKVRAYREMSLCCHHR